MADIFTETFGDKLLAQPLDDFPVSILHVLVYTAYFTDVVALNYFFPCA